MDFDVVVAGGGLVGLSMAAALGTAGLSVLAVDDRSRPARLAEKFDGRVSAVAEGSRRVLDGIGAWPVPELDAQPILEIRVADRGSPFFVHYDHQDVGQGPLGFIAENRWIRQALFDAIDRCPSVRVQAPARVLRMVEDGAGAVVAIAQTDGTEQLVRTKLVVGADGRASPLREAAGIDVIGWTYAQHGIVVTVEHERPHEGVAVEHFLPAGPFAILPMVGNRSSLVWTEEQARVPGLLAASDEVFTAEMRQRFGSHLGEAHPVGQRWSYPLSLQLARSFQGPRLALIGEAAHVIHPIAGQGFNLALRSVAALAELIVDYDRLGLDIGAPELLERYEQRRRVDSFVLAGVTDGLNRLFSTRLPPVQVARDLGLGMVERMPQLKRLLMRHAMGLVGNDVPRLIREGRL